MRAVFSTTSCFALLLLASSCRSTAPAPDAGAGEATPARAAVALEPRVETSTVAEPGREPVRAAAAQEPGLPAPVREHAHEANRDRHGSADVGAYIAHLESAARVGELRIDTVLEKLALPVDAWVGDLGCGPGAFTIAFAKAVPDGVVFAADIEPRQLDVVLAKLRSNVVTNVIPVLASDDDPHFPRASLDVVFIADTYHHLEDRVAYMRRLSKTLKPGGRLVLLEYKPGKLDVGPPPEKKLKAGEMEGELIGAGWRRVESFDTHPNHVFEVWRPVKPWEKK